MVLVFVFCLPLENAVEQFRGVPDNCVAQYCDAVCAIFMFEISSPLRVKCRQVSKRFERK